MAFGFDKWFSATHRLRAMKNFYLSSVLIAGDVVLFRGPSGSGKSTLCLQLIKQAKGRLVSDDQTLLARDGDQLMAHAAPNISGMIEVFGIGIVEGLPFAPSGPVRLLVDLVTGPNDVERLPVPCHEDILGVTVPCWSLRAHDCGGLARVLVALDLAKGRLKLVSGA